MTLSELVAVEVMGWRVHRRNTAHYVLASEENDTYRAPQAIVGEFRPDTNIADASRALEAVATKYPGGAWHKTRRYDGVWRCEFLNGPNHKAESREETEPMAITIAALRAVGVSDDRIEKARSST